MNDHELLEAWQTALTMWLDQTQAANGREGSNISDVQLALGQIVPIHHHQLGIQPRTTDMAAVGGKHLNDLFPLA